MSPTPPPPLLKPDLLARPGRYAARVIARERLRRVRRAAPAGERPPAEDALHDFRVALRRLRTWLRAFAPELDDTVGRGTLKRLHRISRRTGDARDLEVQRHWLAQPTVRLGRLASGAAAALAERLEAEGIDALARALALMAEELPLAGSKLDRQLRKYEVRVPLDAALGEPSMAVALGRLLRAGAVEVRRTLEAVQSPEQVLEAHQARLAVKHLRYLLESLGAGFRGGPRAVDRLAALQDALGVLHDRHLLLERVRREANEVRAPSPGQPTRRAYTALQSAVHRSMLSEFGRAMRPGRGREAAAALKTVERIAGALLTTTGTP
ncbi:MAG TPA: CHAD domain-containing protein [Gemmatimonadales bacterium]|nr:CHAD domain-containing protein [Gemmatimonadales bacterium]HRZ09292.1 CHAD domain-containing protein [Gemmatimonadales bacterium]